MLLLQFKFTVQGVYIFAVCLTKDWQVGHFLLHHCQKGVALGMPISSQTSKDSCDFICKPCFFIALGSVLFIFSGWSAIVLKFLISLRITLSVDLSAFGLWGVFQYSSCPVLTPSEYIVQHLCLVFPIPESDYDLRVFVLCSLCSCFFFFC